MNIEAYAKAVDITPDSPCTLGGNGCSELWTKVESRLEANFLMLREEGKLKLLVTFDLLYVGQEITELIRHIAGEFIEQANIWISASHTHNAPMTD